MAKVYLRPTGSGFKFVKKPANAMPDEKKSAVATLKQLKSAKLVEVPSKNDHFESKWVISVNKI
jgi:hypothetical protein